MALMRLQPILDPDPVVAVVWNGVLAHREAVAGQRHVEARPSPTVCQRRHVGHLRSVLVTIQQAGETGRTMADVMRACDLDDKQASRILCTLCEGGNDRRRYAKRRGEAARLTPQVYLAVHGVFGYRIERTSSDSTDTVTAREGR